MINISVCQRLYRNREKTLIWEMGASVRRDKNRFQPDGAVIGFCFFVFYYSFRIYKDRKEVA